MVLLLVVLFRQNGFPVAFGSLALLLLSRGRHWKILAVVGAACLAIFFLITGPLFDVLDINKKIFGSASQNPTGMNAGVIYINMAYIVYYHEQVGAELLPEEENFLALVTPPGEGLIMDVLEDHTGEAVRYGAAVTVRNPWITFQYLLSKSSFIFQILRPADVRLEFAEDRIIENPFGFQSDTRLPGLRPYLDLVYRRSIQPKLDWLIWRNAFWIYWLIFCAIVASVRLNNWRCFLVITPILLNALPLFLFSGGHIARYIYPTLMAGPLLGGGLLFIWPKLAGRKP